MGSHFAPFHPRVRFTILAASFLFVAAALAQTSAFAAAGGGGYAEAELDQSPLSSLDLFKAISVLFLIALNGFFVAAEFAIVKVRSTRIDQLAEAGSRRAKMSQNLLDHLDSYLSATQLGITIASILLGAVGEETMRRLVVGPLLGALSITTPWIVRSVSFILGTGVIVFLHVVLGEVAPKSYAIQKSEETTLWIAYPLRWFYVAMYPAIHALNGSANAMLRLIGMQPASDHELAHSEEELRLILDQSARAGAVARDKLDLMDNIFDFSRILVRQIMVPRPEVAVFDLRHPLAENLTMAERTAHSRYPLVDGDVDHVIGVVHMKDLFWQLKEMEAGPSEPSETAARRHPLIAGGDLSRFPPSSGAQFLLAIARDVLFVPETMRIDTMLREFQQKRIHMAMVIDEYGGTSGLVTFENVIEELVGEVQDEFDHEAPRIRKITDTEFLIDGVASLDEVNDALDTRLHSEEADTIGGIVLSELGRIPKPGDRVVVSDGIKELELLVREMRRQRIHRISVTVKGKPETHEELPAPAEPDRDTAG